MCDSALHDVEWDGDIMDIIGAHTVRTESAQTFHTSKLDTAFCPFQQATLPTSNRDVLANLGSCAWATMLGTCYQGSVPQREGRGEVSGSIEVDGPKGQSVFGPHDPGTRDK